MLVECLTGRAPSVADGRHRGAAERSGTDALVTVLPAELPEELRALVVAGLAPDPALRPADADALLDVWDRAAATAYGITWTDVGRTGLVERLAMLPQLPPGGTGPVRRVVDAATRRVGTLGRARVLAVCLVVSLVGVGLSVVASGAFAPGTAAPVPVPTMSHVPVGVPGPTVPVPTTGPRADTDAPQQPTGLHVTGRSQTAVSVDWHPAPETDDIAGYIVTRDGRRAGTTYEPGFTVTRLTPTTTYAFTVTAFDAAGNLSTPSRAVSATTLTQPDVSPPTVPTGLRSTGRSTTTVVLVWSRSRDDVGVAGYDVFRDGTLVGSVVRPAFTDTGLRSARTYSYSVRAYDTANNASASSAAVSVRTLTSPDRKPPSTPTGVQAMSAGTSAIQLSWTPSTDNVGVTHYRVYRGAGFVGTATVTAYVDSGLAPATTYSYTVVAVDAAGNRSRHSAARSATTDPLTTTPPPTTTEPPPPPPPAKVTGLSITASPVSAPPECATTLTAFVTVSDDMTVTLTYSINGAGDSTTVDLPEGTHPVTLGVGDGRDNGSASVHHGSYDDVVTWSSPAECQPEPTTDPPPEPSEE
jgi:chitodextrinase